MPLSEPEAAAIVERVVGAILTLGGSCSLMIINGTDEQLELTAIVNDRLVYLALPRGEHSYSDVARELLTQLTLPLEPGLRLRLPARSFRERN